MKTIETSIIMGVYNTANTIEAAIASIFEQTYETFEFIICDDGSTDNTSQILEKCKSIYGERLILLKNTKNQGLAKTLNTCIGRARGEFIARMDGDDISHPDRLEKQIKFLIDNPQVAFVGSNAVKFDENGPYGFFRNSRQPKKEELLYKSRFIHPTIVFRRNCLNSVGGYCESDYCLRCEDYDLWLRLYAKGYFGANIQEELLDYYEGSQNLSKRKYRYRVNEAIVRYKGFKSNKILLRGLPYVFKPLIVGLISPKVVNWVKRIKG